MQNPKIPTVFQVEYYKPSGKLYATGSLKCEATYIVEGCCFYMNDAVEAIKNWENTNSGQGLPGLNSDSWEGPIRISHPLGHPVLIPF